MKLKPFFSIFILAFFSSFLFACSSSNNLTDEDDTTNSETNQGDSDSDFDTNSSDSTFTNAVVITYTSSGATVTSNPYENSGVSVSVSGGDVSVVSTTSTAVNYVLKGTSTNGMFKVASSTNSFGIVLNGLSLINNDGPAIDIESSVDVSIHLVGTTNNRLIDNSAYASTSESATGTVYSTGNLTLAGSGSLILKGYAKHAIASAAGVWVSQGNITVSAAYKDGIHSSTYFRMSGGTLNISSTNDGIECEDGNMLISGGTLQVTSTTEDVKALKAGGTITVTGGTIGLTVSGNQSKGFKSSGETVLSGGTITIATSGGVVLTASGSGYDPSYCTGIKSDTDVTISGASVTITSTGTAGKGISCNGNFTITSGTLTVSTSGAGATYKNTSGTTDSYSATCVSVDGLTNLYGGTTSVASTGSAGKGISSDGNLVIGASTSASGPTVTAKTTGAKFAVSGSGQNADYANAKAIKSAANITVNSGNITITTAQDGAEGLESKATLTINGGTFDVQAYDDCINASSAIVINGGNIYCYSSGNDGIDSNGTLTVTGGVVVSSGTTAPEEGFDCDSNTFKVTGGILIGTGGATSTPTSSVSTQRTVVYGGTGTSGQIIHIESSTGTEILTYKIPRTYSSMTLLFSSPNLASGTTYSIYTGGSVSGGTEFHGYYTGATYTKGTSSNTFTASSMVTTVGTSSTSGGGGGR